MRRVLLACFALVPLTVLAQTEESVETVAEIARLNREVMVPDQLVREIERWYISDYRMRNPKKEAEDDIHVLGSIKRRLLDLSLAFGPLKGKALAQSKRVNLPTGGGIVDFSDLLSGDRGGFSMQVSVEHPPKTGRLRVFYVSGAKHRVLDDGAYGSGCDKWAEMTSWFEKTLVHQPLKLYATEQRHISVVGGTWVFSQLNEDELWLAALTLKDSRFPALQCTSG